MRARQLAGGVRLCGALLQDLQQGLLQALIDSLL